MLLQTIPSYTDKVSLVSVSAKKNIKNKALTHSGVCLIPELLLSQISVPRLLEESASSGCSMLMLPCFFAKRGGILDAMVLFFTGTLYRKERKNLMNRTLFLS